MECPLCLDPLVKPTRPSLTATCQRCDKGFHLECLFESEDKGNQGCPMCRCHWPIVLVDDGYEMTWSCEKCNKEFLSRNRCDEHELRCGKSPLKRLWRCIFR